MAAIPKTDAIEIRILSTKGCANTPPTVSRIKEIAKELAVADTYRECPNYDGGRGKQQQILRQSYGSDQRS